MTKMLENLPDTLQPMLRAGTRQERVIVIGYGNTLRSDDGAGQKAAEIVDSWQLPGVRSIAVHQLTPELAEILATAELVIFVDVYGIEQSELALENSDIRIISIANTASGKEYCPTDKDCAASIGSGHVADPYGLLYLTDLVYDQAPAAWWILIPAGDFQFGEQLSPFTIMGMDRALQQIHQLVFKPMHELSLMESTVEIALDYAHREGVQKILQFNVRVGEMSGVVPEALEFAFDACTQGTIAAGAQLQIELVPVLCYCQHCDREFAPPDLIYVCPNCGTISSKILQGQELQLISLEVS
jgi:hydrogenase nickel insertion protein HypA